MARAINEASFEQSGFRLHNLRINNWVACVLAACWLALIGWTVDPTTDDLGFQWRAAQSFLTNGSPYTVFQTSAHRVAYLYPPLLAYLLQPLALLRFGVAQHLWFGINLLIMVAFTALTIRWTGSHFARRSWGLVLLLMAVAPPTRLALQLGQISLWLALLIVTTLAVWERHPRFASFCLTLAALLKLFPALLAFPFVRHRSRAMLFWCVVMGTLWMALPTFPFGLHPYVGYWQALHELKPYPYSADFNISLRGFWDRLFHGDGYAVPLLDLPQLAVILSAISSVLVAAFCWWRGRLGGSRAERLLTWGMWICGTLLVTPANGYYNLVILLFPLLAMLRALEEIQSRRISIALLFATALIWFPPTWESWQPLLYTRLHTGWGILLLTPALGGLCAYLVLLDLCRRRLAALQAGTDEHDTELSPTMVVQAPVHGI